MKGVILAGGNATRLRPLTLVTNKHLLPIYNKPMIYYPIESMAKAGIKDVIIITGPNHAGSFMNLLRGGKNFGLRLFYEIQEEAGGLSHALALTRDFLDGEKSLVILGDNLFFHDLSGAVNKFKNQEKGAMVFAKEMENCSQYGVVEMKDGKVISIEEKPARPKSNLAQTGIYMYDGRVFDFIDGLEPSARGELEITDLNNIYVKEGTMSCEILKDIWIDAGTSYDELYRANKLIYDIINKKNI